MKTPRKLWGNTFDGTGDIKGNITIQPTDRSDVSISFVAEQLSDAYYDFKIGKFTDANSKSSFGIAMNQSDDTWKKFLNITTGNNYDVKSVDILTGLNVSGNVGIGTTSPSYKLHVVGNTYLNGDVYVDELNTYDIIPRATESYSCGYSGSRWYQVYSYIGNFSGKMTLNGLLDCYSDAYFYNVFPQATSTYTLGSSSYCWNGVFTSTDSTAFNNKGIIYGGYVARIGANSSGGIGIYANQKIYLRGGCTSTSASTTGVTIDESGNMLVTGGITMYSDRRKKTILRDVELSLKEVASAPLIEHFYNSDDKKTTHVGSIAQYWAGLNDWFCKLDSEGYYTMEIQNAALASAISVARELDRYENKTDKQIKKLKKRICELEEEVERLKAS